MWEEFEMLSLLLLLMMEGNQGLFLQGSEYLEGVDHF
jgi:hypothetical protein